MNSTYDSYRYRGMPHRNCVLMNARDVELAESSEHERVSVREDAGQLDEMEMFCGDVRQGRR